MTSRKSIHVSGHTDAHRLIHGASDGHPGLYIERLGDHLLVQSDRDRDDRIDAFIEEIRTQNGCRSAYWKQLRRDVRHTTPEDASPRHIAGEPAPNRFSILENGITYEASFEEGYSYGLFLDQRENRARLADGRVAKQLPAGGHEPARLLNAFAYTCAFSVCAAKGGFETTSLDLSRKYLNWGRRNFELNGLDPAQHDFIYGDVFDWFKRLRNKGREFEAIVLDPPTFSRSKKKQFKAGTDYGKLVELTLPILAPGGLLFASTNSANFSKANFLQQVEDAVIGNGREILRSEFVSQPPDFPISSAEPAYLKTVWITVA
ncbi:MAG: hypothetical protein CMO80_07885 [Verrucomicrobiales bacterium]|nr:hypothetical protein [Verrucomicrobiales bacterium]